MISLYVVGRRRTNTDLALTATVSVYKLRQFGRNGRDCIQEVASSRMLVWRRLRLDRCDVASIVRAFMNCSRWGEMRDCGDWSLAMFPLQLPARCRLSESAVFESLASTWQKGKLLASVSGRIILARQSLCSACLDHTEPSLSP